MRREVEMLDLYQGDCLEVMKQIPDGSVDMILADPPYGTTACKWDSIIPLEPMWAHLKRIAKRKASICLMGSQPYTSTLIVSNLKQFRTLWVWDKKFAANFAQAKYYPMKIHEDIVCFAKETPNYYPEMIERDSPIRMGKNYSRSGSSNLQNAKPEYDRKIYTKKYPQSILHFSTRDTKNKKHPTQKPVALMEYLIKTYTQEGEAVLDFCMGSGTTGVACLHTNRNFIGIELDEGYFKIAKKRIEKEETVLFSDMENVK